MKQVTQIDVGSVLGASAPQNDGNESTPVDEVSASRVPAVEQVPMRAAVATAFGQPDDVLSVRDDCMSKPVLMPVDDPKQQRKNKNKMVVKVKAVSLSPGDYRMLLGQKTVVAKPASFPYVPCGDLCGVVEEVPDNVAGWDVSFKKGDCIVGTWSMFGEGGLADYALVDMSLAAILPSGVSSLQGAAAANSATHAMKAVEEAEIQSRDRVLVLGGSGGVGSAVVQFARRAGASYIAATSTDEIMLKELGVDRVINYEELKWWELPEYRDDKFDVIIDCAVGSEAWKVCDSVLKSQRDGNGRFVAIVANDWHIIGDNWLDVAAYMSKPLGRWLNTMLNKSKPAYKAFFGDVKGTDIVKVLDLVEKNELKIILDPGSPFPFTTEGVRDAFNLHIKRKGHGKIVFKVQD